MFTETRKIHILEEVLKTTNEGTLAEIEKVLEKSKNKKLTKKTKPSIYDFVGIVTHKEASQMRRAINETCETINADDWK